MGLRFECKNLETKLFAQACRSRVNICRSLTVRHSFLFAHNMYFKNGSDDVHVIELGPTSSVNGSPTWAVRHGIKYNVGDTVCLFQNEDCEPSFGKLEQIEKNR